MTPQFIVKCGSHRARKRLFGALSARGQGKPQGYWSFDRPSCYGAYEVPADLLPAARAVKGVTLLRAPYDDMRQCW